ncbi:MFS transporter [Gordonia sinesedis]
MRLPTLTRDDLRAGWLILVACLSVSMVVAAMAALNTALPDIAVDTGATSAQMTWIVDGYTLALAALLLPAGAIGDRLGRRGVLIVGLLCFGAASLAAIWVSDPTQLIVTRALAGAAAALIMPATLSLITSGVPEDKRALGISVWAAIAGAGAIAGFLITGVLLEFFGWHSIFITFAVSSVVAAGLCLTIGTSRDRNPGPFDVPGSVACVLAVTGVVFGLVEAPQRGWSDPLVLVCLVGGALLAVAFCLIEARRRSPLLDIRLFANRAFAAGSLSVAMQFLASFGAFFLLLQQLQLVFGYSPLQSAWALMPFVAGVGVFSLVGNWLAVRFHVLRFVLTVGIALAGIASVALGVTEHESYWGIAWQLGIFAAGIGLATAPSTTAIMSNTPLDNQGVGSAVNDTARELGAAIGIAVAGSIMAAGYTARIGPTAEMARDQLTAAGQQRIAAGDTAGGQAVLDQAATIAETIRRSLAEAIAVAERLSGQAAPLAERITEGARDAFVGPMNQGYITLGSVLIVSAAVLFWLAPRRVTEPSAEPSAEPAPAESAVETSAVDASVVDGSAAEASPISEQPLGSHDRREERLD